ncbi:MAG: hypothetical protein ACTSUF_02110 [Candidatus Heimdallarchaeaceae archaeon]
MHLLGIMEAHPTKFFKYLDQMRTWKYIAKDKNGKPMSFNIQVRVWFPIDIVVQESGVDNVLDILSGWIIPDADKMGKKVLKMRKYLRMFGGLDKLPPLPKTINPNSPTAKDRHAKLYLLGTVLDYKNQLGMDRL